MKTQKSTAHVTIDLDDVRRAGGVKAALAAWCEQSDDTSCGVIGPSFSCSGPGSGWQINHDESDYASRAFRGGALYYLDIDDGRLIGCESAEDADETCTYRDISADGQTWINDLRGSDPGFPDVDPARMTAEERDTLATYLRADDPSLTDDAQGLSSDVADEIEALDAELPDDVQRDMGGGLYREGSWSDESVVCIECPDIEDAMDEPPMVAEMAAAVISYHHPESPCRKWRELIEQIRAAAEALEDIDIDDLPSE